MKFRKATKNDIEKIHELYLDGSSSLKDDGVNQWQGIEKPSMEDVIVNIKEIYVLEKDGDLVSTARITGHDRAYDKIYDGNWITDLDYFSIHKVATSLKNKKMGYASKLFLEIENLARRENIKSLKVDTHEDNRKMRAFLEHMGYEYCGIVYLEVEGKRIAYEKVLD